MGVEVADGVQVDTGTDVALAVGAAVETVDGTLVGLDKGVVALVAVQMDGRFEGEHHIGKKANAKAHPPYSTPCEVGTNKGIGQHGFVGFDTKFFESFQD